MRVCCVSACVSVYECLRVYACCMVSALFPSSSSSTPFLFGVSPSHPVWSLQSCQLRWADPTGQRRGTGLGWPSGDRGQEQGLDGDL